MSPNAQAESVIKTEPMSPRSTNSIIASTGDSVREHEGVSPALEANFLPKPSYLDRPLPPSFRDEFGERRAAMMYQHAHGIHEVTLY